MNAIMIDIETLGLTPTSVVHQIGYCAADLRAGKFIGDAMNLYVEPLDAGQSMDFDTICWWMRQSDAARNAVFPDNVRRTSVMGAHHALRTLYDYLGGKDAGVTVWASPAMFDLPILTHAFANCGLPPQHARDPKPWPYNMERDLMTLYKCLDPDKVLQPPPNTLHHDAASDAKWQMQYLINIYKANPQLLTKE